MGKRKKRYSGGDETIFEIGSGNQDDFDLSAWNKNDAGKDRIDKKPRRPLKSKETKKTDSKKGKNVGSEPGERNAIGLRIIGGKFRGSKLQYIGDHRVRPMKDRVREAVFNLIGPDIKGLYVVDLFGGTGALSIEAISRGAVGATIIELHLPTASLLRQNLESLDLLKYCSLRKTDAFFWAKYKEEHPVDGPPWIVFCSPPYDFYVSRKDEMIEMIGDLIDSAPIHSLFVIESDNRFDFDLLPIKPHPNKIRSYPPAEIAIFYKETEG